MLLLRVKCSFRTWIKRRARFTFKSEQAPFKCSFPRELKSRQHAARTPALLLTSTPCACILSHDLNPPLQNFCHLLLMLLLAVGAADTTPPPRRNRVCTDAEAEGGGNSKEEKQEEEEGLKQLFCHCCASLPVKGAGNRALMAPNVASICTFPLTDPHFSLLDPRSCFTITSLQQQ